MSDQQQALDGDEADDVEEAASEEDEYKRKTIYLRETKKGDFDDWLKMLELNLVEGVDSEVPDIAERREMHEALVEFAMDNPSEYVEKLEECIE